MTVNEREADAVSLTSLYMAHTHSQLLVFLDSHILALLWTFRLYIFSSSFLPRRRGRRRPRDTIAHTHHFIRSDYFYN